MLASLLIALAPSVSWVQRALAGQDADRTGVHQTADEHAQHHQAAHALEPSLPPLADAGHGTHGQTTGNAHAPADDTHGAHGAACDYCLITARALMVAAICLLLTIVAVPAPVPAAEGAPGTGADWAAHLPRGPPAQA